MQLAVCTQSGSIGYFKGLAIDELIKTADEIVDAINKRRRKEGRS